MLRPEIRQHIAAALFFGSLITFNNPFFALGGTVKFALFGLIQGLAFVVAMGAGKVNISNLRLVHFVFVLLYAAALFRVQPVLVDLATRSTSYFIFAGLLCMLTFLNACILAATFDLTMLRRYVVVALFPAALMIALNVQSLTSFRLAESYALGDFSFHGYLTIALTLGIGGLCALGEIRVRSGLTISNAFYGLMFLLCAYGIFNGQARGEAIGFVLAVGLLYFPRLTLIALPFSYSLLQVVVNLIDTPLTVRMQAILNGNYGLRDILFEYGLTMVLTDVKILLVGGGMNAFQNHFSLSAGLYPHNIFIEAATSGGILLAIAVAGVYLLPVVRLLIAAVMRRLSPNERFSLAFMTFLLIAYLKSGSLLEMWSLCLFTCVFLWTNWGLDAQRTDAARGGPETLGKHSRPLFVTARRS